MILVPQHTKIVQKSQKKILKSPIESYYENIHHQLFSSFKSQKASQLIKKSIYLVILHIRSRKERKSQVEPGKFTHRSRCVVF